MGFLRRDRRTLNERLMDDLEGAPEVRAVERRRDREPESRRSDVGRRLLGRRGRRGRRRAPRGQLRVRVARDRRPDRRGERRGVARRRSPTRSTRCWRRRTAPSPSGKGPSGGRSRRGASRSCRSRCRASGRGSSARRPARARARRAAGRRRGGGRAARGAGGSTWATTSSSMRPISTAVCGRSRRSPRRLTPRPRRETLAPWRRECRASTRSGDRGDRESGDAQPRDHARATPASPQRSPRAAAAARTGARTRRGRRSRRALDPGRGLARAARPAARRGPLGAASVRDRVAKAAAARALPAADRLGRLTAGLHTPFDAFERASDAVARGNLRVFEEIGLEFARYLEECPPRTPTASIPRRAPAGRPAGRQPTYNRRSRTTSRALGEHDPKARASWPCSRTSRSGSTSRSASSPRSARRWTRGRRRRSISAAAC